uniref:Radial spoke head 3 n=1 Tax=Cynoglossus semilaevis TaxID=244447 RepID=A0A3P8VLX4_CYNSE
MTIQPAVFPPFEFSQSAIPETTTTSKPLAEGTGCQTDTLPFVPPIVIPPKTGRDAATQLEERDLIVFDRDVRPVVEILVGKTIEQSLLEVMEEEELAFVRAQQKALQEILNEERAQVHRLQEQERRHREAKESKMAQQWKVLMKEKETAEKIAAWAYTQRYLADLKPTVITTLKNDGFLYDPVERDLETNFMPGLLSEIYVVMEGRQAAREVLDTVMYQVSHIRLKVLRAAQRAVHFKLSTFYLFLDKSYLYLIIQVILSKNSYSEGNWTE